MSALKAVKVSETCLEVTKTVPKVDVKTRHERAAVERQLKEIEAQREYANLRFDEQRDEAQSILDEMDKQGVVAEPVKIEKPVEAEKP